MCAWRCIFSQSFIIGELILFFQPKFHHVTSHRNEIDHWMQKLSTNLNFTWWVSRITGLRFQEVAQGLLDGCWRLRKWIVLYFTYVKSFMRKWLAKVCTCYCFFLLLCKQWCNMFSRKFYFISHKTATNLKQCLFNLVFDWRFLSCLSEGNFYWETRKRTMTK